MSFIPKSSIPIAMQSISLTHLIPTFRSVKLTPHRGIWHGFLRANDLGKEYKVSIDYSLRRRPIVKVLDHKFDARPPHTFKDESLCLYHRDGRGAWNSRMSIGKDLVPMIAHWLWCFELWQVTGVWYGEEFAHTEPKAG